MKILIASPVAESAHVRRIPAALAKHNDVQVTVVAPHRIAVDKVYDPSGWITHEKEEITQGFRFIPLPLIDPQNFDLGYAPKALQKIVRDVNPDIIQVWSGPTSNFIFQVAWARTRAFSRAKIVFYGFDNLPIPLSRCTIPKWRLRWTQISAGLEADSEAVRNIKAAGFRAPVERIFWGIPAEDFEPTDKTAARSKLGLPQTKIVGYVGRLTWEKGLMFLLGAMRRLPETTHCVMIGSGPMRAELDIWIDLLGLQNRVKVLGPLSAAEVGQYMTAMDVLALPSLTTPLWKEQYGRVLGEAMACGVPVVGSNSGAIPEVIGDAGVVVSEGDTLALEAGLQKALFDEDFRKQVIPLGIERAHSELSVEAMSSNLLRFYQKLLNRH